ncbi:NAD-dependent deacetylase [Amycolatopsis sp. cg5]|uniref:SIR2 family NAD-dependent protein deacylase n=1 Tax=Amycolatopsis sp. cg5 TaxID=3238802 RepID=UPI0035266027
MEARELVAGAGRIVALTGAGISTDSGIPDFRGPNGLWTKNPGAEKMSNLRAYSTSREVREQTWQARLVHPGWSAEPNAAHHALVDLERTGRLRAIITQNIDRLHQKAGSSVVIELHGTMFESVCLSCADRRDMREALDRVRAGETDPPCLVCGGILKSATISFGQSLDRKVFDTAKYEARTCDLLIAAGTSLAVQPAAGLVGLAASHGAKIIICNASETPYDGFAAAILRAPLGEVLPQLVG